jgi:hypothetical protein
MIARSPREALAELVAMATNGRPWCETRADGYRRIVESALDAGLRCPHGQPIDEARAAGCSEVEP